MTQIMTMPRGGVTWTDDELKRVNTKKGPMDLFRFGLAISSAKLVDGKWETISQDFFRVTVWNEDARIAAALMADGLGVGAQVTVTGQLKISAWSRDGKSGINKDINALRVDFTLKSVAKLVEKHSVVNGEIVDEGDDPATLTDGPPSEASDDEELELPLV